MSLIQQALEKKNRSEETKKTAHASTSKIWERGPMGLSLEKELIQVQAGHDKRRRFFEKMLLGVFVAIFILGAGYYGRGNKQPGMMLRLSMPAATIIPHVPLKIFSGNIYRLTGITNVKGQSMAVINGQIVSVGDSLSDKAIVKTIGHGKVHLDVQGKEIILTL